MTLKPTSFRLAPDTLARLKSLAQPHEPLAQVIARALIALETQEQAQDVAVVPVSVQNLIDRMDGLEVRLDALEASGALTRLEAYFAGSASALQNSSANVAHNALQAPDSRATASDNTSQNEDTGRATGSAYPPEVRRMAVALADSGTAPSEIRQRIMDACGRAPHRASLARLLRQWREQGAAQDGASEG